MNDIAITKETARRYMLIKNGLYGDYIFGKEKGALDYVRQAGCIQFDPVDSVGKNAELTLQSRVKDFRKIDLYNLLYRDRCLVDYFDKELAIIPTKDWPYFRRYREMCKENGKRFKGLKELEVQALDYIAANGNVSSATLPIEGKIKWHSYIHWSGSWSGGDTKAARSVLEQLYTTGDLVIHHKEGTRKYYDLAGKYLPEKLLCADDPLPDNMEHIKWRIKRRIGAVGMLWNKNSAAFLGVWNLDTDTRNTAFQELEESGEIAAVHIDGLRPVFYVLQQDVKLIKKAENVSKSNRLEFLAPLDPMLWDRKLVEAVFDFKYTWEIYTPKEKRQYGYYVLPIVSEDRMIGRIEPVIKDDMLIVNGIWLEEGVRKTKKLDRKLNQRLKKFARFNKVIYKESGCL